MKQNHTLFILPENWKQNTIPCSKYWLPYGLSGGLFDCELPEAKLLLDLYAISCLNRSSEMYVDNINNVHCSNILWYYVFVFFFFLEEWQTDVSLNNVWDRLIQKFPDILSKRPGLERVDSLGDMFSDSSAQAFFRRDIPDLLYVFERAEKKSLW